MTIILDIIPALNLNLLPAQPFFQLSLGRPLAPLKESLGRLGQFEPIIASREQPGQPDSGLIVISGYRRLTALKELGRDQALAAIAQVPRQELLALALEANLARGFNQAEKIMAAAAWEAEGRPFPPARLSRLLNEPLGPKQLSAYQAAARLPREFLEAFATESFDLGDYLELAQWPLEEARALSRLWAGFALSRQKRHQVAQLIGDIARRENLTPQAVMAGPEVQAAGTFLERSGKPQAGEWLRQALLRRRQPQLAHWRDQRQRQLKSLALKYNLGLSWDGTLEDPSLKLGLTFTSLDQFKEQVDYLVKLTNEPALASLCRPWAVEAPFTPVKP